MKAVVVDAAHASPAPKDRGVLLGKTAGLSNNTVGTPRGARPGSRSSTGSQPTTPRMVPNRAVGSLSAGRTRSDAIGFGSSTGHFQHTPSRSHVISMNRAPGMQSHRASLSDRKASEVRRPKQAANESPTQGSFRNLRALEQTSPRSSPKTSPKASPKASPRSSPQRADGPDGKLVRSASPPQSATSLVAVARRCADRPAQSSSPPRGVRNSDGPSQSSSPPRGVRKAPESKPARSLSPHRGAGSSPTPSMRRNHENKSARGTSPTGSPVASPTPAARKSPKLVRPTSPSEAKAKAPSVGKQRAATSCVESRGEAARRATTPPRTEISEETPRRVCSPKPKSFGPNSGAVRRAGSLGPSSQKSSPAGSPASSSFISEPSPCFSIPTSASPSEAPRATSPAVSPELQSRNLSPSAFGHGSRKGLSIEHPSPARLQARGASDVLTSCVLSADSIGHVSPRPSPKGSSITVPALLPSADPTGYLSPRPPPRGASVTVAPGNVPASEAVARLAPARLASVPTVGFGPLVPREGPGFCQPAAGAFVPPATSMWAGAQVVQAQAVGPLAHAWQASSNAPSGNPAASPPVPSFAFAGPGKLRSAPPPMTMTTVRQAARPVGIQASGSMRLAPACGGGAGSMSLPPGNCNSVSVPVY